MKKHIEIELSEICEIFDCEHKTAPIDNTGKYLSIRTTDISNGRILIENANRVAENTYNLWIARAKPSKGDILLAREAPVGEVGLVKLNNLICLGQRTVLIRPCSKDIDGLFLLYYLVNPEIKHELQSRSTGSVVQHLNVKDIREFILTLPPLPEQHAIASVLSSLDDKIDLLHRQNKTLEAMAETLFRQWFVEEADEGWEVTTLDQHVEVSRGLSYKGNGLAEKDGMPMHNLNSIYEGGGYKAEGIKYYRGEYKERHLGCPGDIIVANTEQGHEFKLIGFPAIIPDIFGNIGIFSQHIYKLTPNNQTYLSREYLYYLLLSPAVREQVISATNGSTVNMLSIDGLRRPEFKLPPKNKVLAFIIFIRVYWKKIEMNNRQILTLGKNRDMLLPKLMSGECCLL